MFNFERNKENFRTVTHPKYFLSVCVATSNLTLQWQYCCLSSTPCKCPRWAPQYSVLKPPLFSQLNSRTCWATNPKHWGLWGESLEPAPCQNWGHYHFTHIVSSFYMHILHYKVMERPIKEGTRAVKHYTLLAANYYRFLRTKSTSKSQA
jgi:hypothetical protein